MKYKNVISKFQVQLIVTVKFSTAVNLMHFYITIKAALDLKGKKWKVRTYIGHHL